MAKNKKREKRRAAELLKVEGWQFFQLCGKYDGEGSHQRAFPRFAGEVENMIAGEIGEYLAVFAPSLEQYKAVTEEAFKEIIAGTKKNLATMEDS